VDDERTGADRAQDALDGARREAAGRTIEDQGTEGGLTEATHGAGEPNPAHREGEGAPERS
jgi:hypothetical protein